VVIAIIAILASLLLPALSKAKAKAHAIACVNNEKQIALGYLMYVEDSGGWLPISGISGTGWDWIREISTYVFRAATNNVVEVKGKVIICPSAVVRNAIPTNLPYATSYGGYGHNYYYLGYMLTWDHPDFNRQKMSRLTKQSETVMNGDGLDPGPGLDWYNLGYLYPPPKIPSGAKEIRPFVRHGKGGNYAWADGHVSAVAWKTLAAGMNGKLSWYYSRTAEDADAR
jgi:prepilin-type processing-associated H-X9-DG protein